MLEAAQGLNLKRVIGAATTNSTLVKSVEGRVFHIFASNVNAAAVYLKIYDKATAPTVGTDTPVLTYLIPGGTTGGLLNVSIPGGISFVNGIGFGIVGALADNSTTAVSANEQVVNIIYS